jgi:hypothetical protein
MQMANGCNFDEVDKDHETASKLQLPVGLINQELMMDD